MRVPRYIRAVCLIAFLISAICPAGGGSFGPETFESRIRANVELVDAVIRDEALELTSHQRSEKQVGAFKLPDLDPGKRVGSYSIAFDLAMFSRSSRPGEGMTLTFGDIPDGAGDGRYGFEQARGLSIEFDLYDNGDDPPSVELIVSDKTVANTVYRIRTNDARSNRVEIHWDEDGLDMTYAGNVIYDDQGTGDYHPEPGDRLAFSAATRAGNGQTTRIDNLVVNTEEFQPLETGRVMLSEILPITHAGTKDEDLEEASWIELYNGTGSPVNLEGWSLRCGDGRWVFPSLSIDPYNYSLVFATGKDRRNPNAPLHTSFRLPQSGGELMLSDRTGTGQMRFKYGEASPDVSFGWVEENIEATGFIEKPTPGAKNRGELFPNAEAPSVALSHSGGIVGQAVTVTISSGELPEGAVIRYSLGAAKPKATSPIYEEPITIVNSTILRASVFASGYTQGPVAQSAFVFLDPEVQRFSSNLPVVVSETAGVDIDAEFAPWVKRKYRAVHTSIFEPGEGGLTSLRGTPAFGDFGAMRVRGHSSATNFPKKQYAWEVRDNRGEDKDVPLLGMPAESDWILAAPYSDKSLMRNVLAFELGRELFGQGGGSRTRFVELFVNQNGDDVTMRDYQGVYVLTEKIKKGPERIPIKGLSNLATDPEVITGGYIFNLDKGLDWDEKVRTKLRALRIGLVDPDEPNAVQKEYLERYLNNYEQALDSDDFADPQLGYPGFIDVDSFIHLDWMVEIFREIDGWWISSYFTKDRGEKMRAMPVWDYNLSLGNADYASGYLPTGWHRDAHSSGGHPWFRRLHDDPEFVHRYWKRYFELRKTLFSTENLLGRMDAHAARIQQAAERNFRRWPILGRYVWPNAPGYRQRRTFQAEVDWMKNWLKTRLEWIDKQYIAPPGFSRSGEVLTMSLLSGVTGEIFYTIDGTDPGFRGELPWKTLISSANGRAEVLVPTGANGGARLRSSDWTSLSPPPNKAQWKTAASGVIGYESEPEDYAGMIKHDVHEMWNRTTSCFIRIPFVLDDLGAVQSLSGLALRMRCDDGFVAYLNGVRIADKNAPDSPVWNSAATASTNDRKAKKWEAFDISDFKQHFLPGANMLAIHGLNHSASSTDALWAAEIAVIDPAPMQPAENAVRYIEPIRLNDADTAKVRAAVFTGKRWGVVGELP